MDYHAPSFYEGLKSGSVLANNFLTELSPQPPRKWNLKYCSVCPGVELFVVVVLGLM